MKAPTEFVRLFEEQKWVALKASLVGFAVFELLGIAVRFVASEIDRALFTHVTSSTRQLLLQYRVWELYRAVLYCIAAALAGRIVARAYRSHLKVALTAVAVVIGISLFISLFTGPGYYGRDLLLIATIILSPFVGGCWSRASNTADPNAALGATQLK